MTTVKAQVSVVISKDGPYVVSGDAPLTEEIIGANAEGESVKWQRSRAYDAPAKYALCRCGQSAKAPFCDGTHAKVGFDGTETASRTPFAERCVRSHFRSVMIRQRPLLGDRTLISHQTEGSTP